MSRTKGARNADFASTRRAMADRLRRRLADRGRGAASLRDLAEAAGVGLSTLAHYFGRRREQVVEALLRDAGEAGGEHLQRAATPTGPFARSIRDLLEDVALGHAYGVGDLHAAGLAEGLNHGLLGPTYVREILEPTVQAVERRLGAHVAVGEMRPDADLRVAAIELLAPMLIAHLHQGELGGVACRPLDLTAFREAHAAAFVRAYAVRG